MTILLTGFEPFGSVTVNPSQQIVEHFAQQQNMSVVTGVLPVVYDVAADQLIELIEQHNPQAIIMLGVAQRRDAINLERVALNIEDASIADNAGFKAQGKRIIEDAPVGYWSTLPLETMYDALRDAEIPVKYSNHAGAYLCNHVFYHAVHHITSKNLETPVGFIHIPAHGDKPPNMPLAEMIRAIDICIQVVASQSGVTSKRRQLERILDDTLYSLYPQPQWGALISADGLVEATYSRVYDEERVSAMTAAAMSLGERIISEIDNGDIKYTILNGDTSTIIVHSIDDEHYITLDYERVTNLDDTINQVKTAVAELGRFIGGW